MSVREDPNEAKRGAHWVKPEMVAQVRFATWTGENQLRQAAYLGLREDKPAREVRRENAAPTPKRAKGAPQKDEAVEETSGAKKAATAKTAPAVKKAVPAKSGTPLLVPAVRLTHPAKVVDTESGVTKQQLAGVPVGRIGADAAAHC